jgi:twitching motility protein PilU
MEKSMAEGSQTFEDDIARMIRLDMVDQREGLINSDSPTNLMWKLGNQAQSSVQTTDPVKEAAYEAEMGEAAQFTEIVLDVG